MRRLALFDLDNTLIDRTDLFARWSAGFAASYDLPAEAPAWLVDADGDGFVPRTDFFGLVRDRFGLAEPVDRLWADYRASYPTYARIRPEVLDGLVALRAARWRVGIVTNGATRTQRSTIERVGRTALVDAVCVSEEVGVRKPDPTIFAVAAHRCGTTLSGGGWMIGDSAEHDVRGGAGVGLSTIWISRGRAWTDAATPPDRTCDDVVEAIDELRASCAGHHVLA
jgi:putative hydrolase of the HAD superfamily